MFNVLFNVATSYVAAVCVGGGTRSETIQVGEDADVQLCVSVWCHVTSQSSAGEATTEACETPTCLWE